MNDTKEKSRLQKNKNKKTRSKNAVIILAAAGIIIVAAVLGAFTVRLFFNRKDASREAAEVLSQGAPLKEAGGTAASGKTAARETKSPVSYPGSSPAVTDAPTPLPSPTPEPVPVQITVTFAGDCTLGTDEHFNYARSFNAYYEKYGPDYFLQNVRPYFQADDLTVVNFEGTLTTGGERSDKTYAFKGLPEYASVLSGSSVEAANMANNHSHDYGEDALAETISSLHNAGITTFGYDTTAVLDIKGVKTGLVGINGMYGYDSCFQQVKDNIAKVKAEGAKLVIVVFHWGNERHTVPNTDQTALGHLAIDEGAHVVAGHHPHVIQPVEKYNGRYILYSLANFCFGGNSAPSDTDTFLFQQTFTVTGDEVAADDHISTIPCHVTSANGYNNYQPTPAEGEDADRILQRIWAPVN